MIVWLLTGQLAQETFFIHIFLADLCLCAQVPITFILIDFWYRLPDRLALLCHSFSHYLVPSLRSRFWFVIASIFRIVPSQIPEFVYLWYLLWVDHHWR